MDRYTSCWKSLCKKENGSTKCLLHYLDCSSFNQEGRKIWANTTTIFKNCNPENDDIEFNYGIFENALTKNVVFSNFFEKYFYCLWWGLQNLRYGFEVTINSLFITLKMLILFEKDLTTCLFPMLTVHMGRLCQQLHSLGRHHLPYSLP